MRRDRLVNVVTLAVVTLWIAVALVWVAVAQGAAQQSAPVVPSVTPNDKADKANLTPTELQTLRLTNKQLVAQLRQKEAQQAEMAFQQSLSDLQAEADKVKAEQGWPKDTAFDIGTLKFTAPPAAKRPVEDPKPPRKETPSKP